MLSRRTLLSSSPAMLIAGCASAQPASPRSGAAAAPIRRPPSSPGNMVATLTVPVQPGLPSGSFVFDEATGRRLDPWVDPRGEFSLTLTQVTRPDFPGFRVIFVRSRDGQWASAEFWFGDSASPNPRNIGRGYKAEVTGDFAGSATTPHHWWGSRWRLSGNATDGLRPGRNNWPYALTDYGRLLTDHLIPQFAPMRPAPSGAPPVYTPMSNVGITTYMGSTGARPDIGIFNEWSAWYFATQAPHADAGLRGSATRALATLQAINEAGASISWFVHDTQKGCLWERLVNHAGSQQGPPGPPLATQIELVATGPVGAKLASTVKDAGSRTPYKVPTVAIPASGRVSVTVRCAEGWWYRPMPTGTPQPSDGDGGITYAWGDVTTYEPASVWGIDSSHQPELGYLSYLLFRDPWDLHTIQADAMCSANTYPQFLEGQARQVAWDYAHAVEAWAATPAAAPGWLLPKSTLAKWVQVIQRWLISRVIDQPGAGGQPELATVFHSIYAAKPVGPQTAKLCDGKITATGPMIQSWQDAFFCQSAALAVILNPGDADAQKLLAYSVRSVADRYDDTGWPKGVKTPYVTRVGDGTRMYRSWAEAWAGNAPMIQVDAKRCPLDPPPPPPQEQNITASNSDYPTGDFAALSLAVQAGLTQYRPQRDFIGAACRRVSVPFARGYAET